MKLVNTKEQITLSLLLCLTFLLSFAVKPVQAQEAPDFEWTKQAGGNPQNVGTSVALDSNGNVYVTGYFLGTATFGESGQGIGEVSLNSVASPSDIYLAKYDSNGALLWVKQTIDGSGNSVALDSNGNVYATGSFKSLFIIF